MAHERFARVGEEHGAGIVRADIAELQLIDEPVGRERFNEGKTAQSGVYLPELLRGDAACLAPSCFTAFGRPVCCPLALTARNLVPRFQPLWR